MIVGVVGAGTMGAGIAQACLSAGHEVVLHDVDEAAIARGRERIEAGLARLRDKGRIDDEARHAALGRLRDAHALAALADEADVVIEAALEDLELKRTIFRALDSATRRDALLATNTSALSVADIAAATERPERVIGLHFFNPAPVMALVEVVVADGTSREAVERGVELVRGLGKEPIVCRDAPGFIVNRVNRPFTLEALRMVEAGLASPAQVDRAVESAGYPMGPFRLMDLVGIDINLAVARALHAAFDEAPRFRPSRLQEERVASGALGRKSGAGFYRYDERGDALGPSEATGAGDTGAGGLDAAAILERIELPIINEAYHAVGEGVAAPPDVDLAMRLGANHPSGPFERAGSLGLRAVVEGLERLARSDEPDAAARFAPAPALLGIAHL